MARRGQARSIEAQLRRIAAEVTGKVQLRCMQTLTSATPVDTSYARGGWTPSVGSPIVERLDRPADEKEATTRGRANQAANMARAREIAKTFDLRMGAAFISNNVTYMVYLNLGSSAQAPARFVERAIDTAVRSFGGRRIA